MPRIRYTTVRTDTGRPAEGQAPFPSRRQAQASADRVNAVLDALGTPYRVRVATHQNNC